MSRVFAALSASAGACLVLVALLWPAGWALAEQTGFWGYGEFTGWLTSEESPPLMCWPNQWPRRAGCQGAYCDNFGFECAKVAAPGGKPALWGARAEFRRWLGGGADDCGEQSAIAGVACKGSYCNEVSLYCVKVDGVKLVNCHDTGSFSEEGGGSFLIGDNKLVRRLTCTGQHCDSKSFQVCDVVAQ